MECFKQKVISTSAAALLSVTMKKKGERSGRMIYELETKLKYTETSVTRTLEVDSGMTFEELHRVLQKAYEWENAHLHQFVIVRSGGTETRELIGPIGFMDESASLLFDEGVEPLGDWLTEKGDELIYLYDFGAGWEHRVTLTDILEAHSESKVPRCTAASGEPAEEDTFPGAYSDSGARQPGTLVRDINQALKSSKKGPKTPETENREENRTEKELNRLVFLPEVEEEALKGMVEAAKRVSQEKPWEHLHSNQIVMFDFPEEEEPHFVSVMGSLGEQFGVMVYRGWDGYRSLKSVFADGFGSDYLTELDALSVSFEDREDLTKEEYSFLKDLGYSFRGKKRWPVFRSYEPGLLPSLPDEWDAHFLTDLLEGVLAVAEIAKKGNHLPEFGMEEKILAFSGDPDGQMIPFYVPVPEAPPIPDVGLQLRELDIKRLLKLPAGNLSLEFDLFSAPTAVHDEETEITYFPLVALGVDREVGVSVFYEMIPNPLPEDVAQAALANCMIRTGTIPGELHVKDRTAAFLKPLLDKLGIVPVIHSRLPMIEELRVQLERRMGR